MDIRDTIKQGVDRLTGESKRKEDMAREAARTEAERTEQARLAEQERQDQLDVTRAQEARDAEQDRKALVDDRKINAGPAERLVDSEESKLKIRSFGTSEPEKPKGREATRMEATPLPQPAPSIAGPGDTWFNPRAVKRPSLADDAAKARQEQAANTLDPQAEQERDRLAREREERSQRERSLYNDLSDGRRRDDH